MVLQLRPCLLPRWTALALIAGAFAPAAFAAPDAAPLTVGEVCPVASRILGEERTVRIRLPSDYARTEQRYPVLYKLDGGSSVFLQTVGAIEYLVDWEQAPDCLVVGIENTDRARDMTLARGAAAFVRFLQDELVPFVDARYRTNDTRILAGQSASSEFAIYALLRAPEVFEGVVLSSFGLSVESQQRLEREIGEPAALTRREHWIYCANARQDTYDPDGSRTRRGTEFLAVLQKTAGPALCVGTRTFADQGHVPFPTIHDALRHRQSTRAGSRAVPTVAIDVVPGLVTEWSLSPTRRPSPLAPESYLDGRELTQREWISVRSEPSGLVDIARFRQPNAQGGSKVWARAIVTVEKAELWPFALGYSGEISLYLNGRKLFQSRSGGERADPSPHQNAGWKETVYLPLESGRNELMLMVTDQLGNWSFMLRDLNAIHRAASLTQAWEHQGRLPAPESVAHDPKRGVLYVSNFSGNSVAKLAMSGDVLATDWVKDVDRPTGLKLHGNRLYAIARGTVVEIDPETGAVVARLPIAGSVFPNDLAIDPAGVIYVTDTLKNCIHRIAGGKSEVWLEGPEIAQPNGIVIEPHRLLVGVSADAAIKAIDLQAKTVTTLVTVSRPANMDGLASDGAGGCVFSDYFGRLYHTAANGETTLLLERRGPRQFCADFEYVPSERLLIVPSLYDDRVTAYHWAPAPN